MYHLFCTFEKKVLVGFIWHLQQLFLNLSINKVILIKLLKKNEGLTFMENCIHCLNHVIVVVKQNILTYILLV